MEILMSDFDPNNMNGRDAMMSFIESLNSDIGNNEDILVETTKEKHIPLRCPTGSPESMMMKELLLAVMESDTPKRNILNNTRHTISEAAATHPTPRGARIGDWEVRVRENGRTKRYDVLHSSGTVVAQDIYIMEAAQALASELNEGKAINRPEIQNILNLENEYARLVEEAARHRYSLREAENRNDTKKADIYEGRYSEARTKAQMMRDRIRDLV
jgi:hypothetical protein